MGRELKVKTDVPADRVEELPDLMRDMLDALSMAPLGRGPITLTLDGPEGRWAAQRLGLPVEAVQLVTIQLNPMGGAQ